MKRNAFFRKLNFLIALGGVLAALAFYGCSNLLSSANDAPANLAQAKEGYGIVSGNLPSSNSANARTAMPSGGYTLFSYKVFAQSGSQKIDANVNYANATFATFSIALPFGTWKITANGLDSGGRIIFTQTKEVTLDATNSTVSLNFGLEYSTNPDDGDGEISLSVNFPPKDATSAISAIKGIEYTLSKGEEKIIQKASDAELAAGKFTIAHTTDNLGAWHLTINFYGDFSNLVYRIDQTVNVYANLRTDTFEGSAPYISGGKIVLTGDLLADFQQTTLYVDAASGKDTNTGTQFDPLATFNRAVELVNNSTRDPSTEFRIFLKSDVADGATLELKSGKKLTVANADGAAHKITSLGRTFTVAVGSELTVQSVKFEKLRFEVSGTFEMNGGEISGNTVTGNGGAISVATTGKAKISGAKIFGNTAENGGGVYVSGGKFIMKDGEISGNKAKNGGAIYVNSGAVFTMEKGTISKNVSTVAGGGVYIDRGTCEMNGGKISDNESADAGGESGFGGGVYVTGGTFTMNSGAIATNTAKKDGGGVYVNDGTFEMKNGKINANTANFGGGIYIAHNGLFRMKDGEINENKTESSNGYTSGGGIHIYNGTFEMDGGEISGNSASHGGGFYVRYNAILKMTQGKISGNTASYGGGVYVNGNNSASGIFTMKGGKIIGNTASVNGGGIWTNSFSEFAMQGGEFNGNTAPKGKGNGAYVNPCTFKMSGEAKFAESDDIYLNDSNQSTFATIQIAVPLSETKVATLTPSTYDEPSREVLSAGAGTITPDICGKFAVTQPESNENDAEWKIVPDSTGAKGILKTKIPYYVRGNNAPWYESNKPNATASDANLGDIDHPFATIQKAIDTVLKENDGMDAYTIYVDGELDGTTAATLGANGMADFSKLTQDLTLTIKALSESDKATLDAGARFDSSGNVTNAGIEKSVIYARPASGSLNLTLENLTITGGNATGGDNNDRGSGIYFKSAGGTLIMKVCSVTENIAGIGGGIYNANTLTMEDCDISGNASKWDINKGSGGGIYNTGDLTMTNCTVKNNIVPGYAYGGGIYNGGVLTMEGGEISGHTATNGGGVYNSGTFTMSDAAKISGNIASGNGGAAKISKNTASVDGGGVSVAGGEFTLKSGTISENTAVYGAGIHISGGGKLTMNGGTVSDNKAQGKDDSGGGGIHLYNGTFEMSDGKISENTANGTAINSGGGGIYIYSRDKNTFTMTGGTFSGNTAANGKGKGAFISGNGVLSMSGAAKFEENDDIYLYDYTGSGIPTIRVAGALTATSLVATITPSTYEPSREVLSAGTGVTITQDICDQFDLASVPAGAEWKIVPDGTGAKGILTR